MTEKASTFAARLREGLFLRDMTQAELAKAAGLDKSSVSRYLKDEYKAKQDAVYRISKVLQVDPAWLMGYDVPMEPAAQTEAVPAGFEPMPRMVKKPLIGDIACGEPITAEQNIAEYVDVPESVHCDFCLRCHGDSMVEAGIQDNDVVYIRAQPEVEDGEIAAVRIGGEATLKRVYYDGQSLTLLPANSSYRPKTYSGQELENIRIEGKAVGFTHWF